MRIENLKLLAKQRELEKIRWMDACKHVLLQLWQDSEGKTTLSIQDSKSQYKVAFFENPTLDKVAEWLDVWYDDEPHLMTAIFKRLQGVLPEQVEEKEKYEPTQQQAKEALELAKNPGFLNLALDELNWCSVGERENLAFLYVITSARYLKPVWFHLSGASRGGKSMITETVLGLVPPEDSFGDVLRFSERGLEYIGASDTVELDGKVIYVMEAHGMAQVMETLRPIYGKRGKRMHTYTVQVGKEKAKGRKITLIGCPTVISTAVLPEYDEQTTKRFWIRSIDESPEQTKQVQAKQAHKRMYPHLYDPEKRPLWRALRDLQYLYDHNLKVLVPYATHISFFMEKPRFRGDFVKLLDLIECVAFIHQFQRPVIDVEGQRFILATKADFQLALWLISEILLPSIYDLPPNLADFYRLAYNTCRKVQPVEDWKTGETIETIEKGLTVNEIAEKTDKAPSTARSYLKQLAEKGLVNSEKTGRTYLYTFQTQKDLLERSKIEDKVKIRETFTKEAFKEYLKSLGLDLAGEAIEEIYKAVEKEA